MLSNDEWRQALGKPDMTDKEIEEFRRGLHVFINDFLDDYLKEDVVA